MHRVKYLSQIVTINSIIVFAWLWWKVLQLSKRRWWYGNKNLLVNFGQRRCKELCLVCFVLLHIRKVPTQPWIVFDFVFGFLSRSRILILVQIIVPRGHLARTVWRDGLFVLNQPIYSIFTVILQLGHVGRSMKIISWVKTIFQFDVHTIYHDCIHGGIYILRFF